MRDVMVYERATRIPDFRLDNAHLAPGAFVGLQAQHRYLPLLARTDLLRCVAVCYAYASGRADTLPTAVST